VIFDCTQHYNFPIKHETLRQSLVQQFKFIQIGISSYDTTELVYLSSITWSSMTNEEEINIIIIIIIIIKIVVVIYWTPLSHNF
jgi:hypothetical protein